MGVYGLGCMRKNNRSFEKAAEKKLPYVFTVLAGARCKRHSFADAKGKYVLVLPLEF
jgi:hypothetical protein